MTPQESLKYLEQLQENRMRLDLKPSIELLELLGRPDQKLRSVIVAGTNGKGSITSYLTHIGVAAGLKVGTYTSPHVESIYERIAIQGRPITPKRFAQHASDLRNFLENSKVEHASYFEFLTMMAVQAFVEEQVDLAIFEVGLGGRLDSTNALERLGVVISRIGRDHMSILGHTLTEIAKEKAAIMRTDRFAVISSQPPEARAVLQVQSTLLGIVPQNFQADFRGEGDDTNFRFISPELEFGPIRLGMRGLHQVMNAATAAQTALRLRGVGFEIPDQAIEKGLATASLPGRLEKWTGPEDKEVWLDVAHNEDAMRALVDYFVGNGQKTFDVVIGMLKDKDWRTVLELIKSISKTVTFCRPNSPRAWNLSHEPPGRAFERVLAASRCVLCTGSFYVVGDIRKALKEKGFSEA
jgi:dihydrofolate synthase / folylpolyglutamate synthase